MTPGSPADPDASRNEVGVKFRADVAGQVTAIRFYKGTGNTGTHVGHLWSATGTLLATVDLHRRDGHRLAAGDLRQPRRGDRRDDLRGVLSTPRAGTTPRTTATSLPPATDAPPLHALKDGADGPNGV